jgi:hypothetical protein
MPRIPLNKGLWADPWKVEPFFLKKTQRVHARTYLNGFRKLGSEMISFRIFNKKQVLCCFSSEVVATVPPFCDKYAKRLEKLSQISYIHTIVNFETVLHILVVVILFL